jgi:hypothetical protein
MVELVVLQSLSYMAGALGVCVAAIYYVLNLREINRNRRASFANNLQQNFQNEDWQNRFMETMNMQWIDFEDFKRKYDSSVNRISYARRHSVLISYDNLAQQYRHGVIDLDSFTDIWAFGVVMCWYKYKPIIDAYRGWQYPEGAFSDFEHLADMLQKRLTAKDPDFMSKMNTFFDTFPVDQ